MSVTAVDALTLRPIPIGVLFATTNLSISQIRPTVVRVVDDSGVVGYGEAMPAWEVTGETQESVAGVVTLYCDSSRLDPDDILVGKPLESLDDVVSIIDRMSPFDRPTTVAHNGAAKAAIEQALLDVVARKHGVSVHALLGVDSAATVPASYTVALLPLERALEKVQTALASGAKTIRLKLGGNVAIGGATSIERDVTLVRESAALVAAYPDVRLAADANEAFVDVERAADFCSVVEGSLDWLEQPFAGDDVLGFAELSRRTSIPLMADESVHGLAHARTLLTLGGVKYLNVKLMKCGGVLTALRMVDLAAQHGVGVYIGSMLETSLGCSASHLVAAARPELIIGTDTVGFSLLRPDPFGLLRLLGDRVGLANTDQVGTGVTAAQVQGATEPAAVMA